jgi:hypothetical protein
MSPNIVGFPKKFYFALSLVAKRGKSPSSGESPVYLPHKFPIFVKKTKKNPAIVNIFKKGFTVSGDKFLNTCLNIFKIFLLKNCCHAKS